MKLMFSCFHVFNRCCQLCKYHVYCQKSADLSHRGVCGCGGFVQPSLSKSVKDIFLNSADICTIETCAGPFGIRDIDMNFRHVKLRQISALLSIFGL